MYILDDILAVVFLKIPFESLVRLRYVSNEWRCIIESSEFMNMYRKRHPDGKIIIWIGHYQAIYSFDSAIETSNSQSKFSFKKLIPWFRRKVAGKKNEPVFPRKMRTSDVRFRDHYLAGSCKGIICMSQNFGPTGYLTFWNPFIGKSSYVSLSGSSPGDYNKDKVAVTTFGYDRLNDDYKVVRYYIDGAKDTYELCIYSLKQKSWRTMRDSFTVNLEPKSGHFPRRCTYVNGAIHWAVDAGMPGTRTHQNSFILAFDLGTYGFRRIPSPPRPDADDLLVSPSGLNGTLFLCYIHPGDPGSGSRHTVHVWVMEEYGVESSWTELACIDSGDLFFWRFKVVAYSEEKRRLLVEMDSHTRQLLQVYDLDTRSMSCLVIDGDNYNQACVCVEDFVNPLHL